jgi:hypothetical protein
MTGTPEQGETNRNLFRLFRQIARGAKQAEQSGVIYYVYKNPPCSVSAPLCFVPTGLRPSAGDGPEGDTRKGKAQIGFPGCGLAPPCEAGHDVQSGQRLFLPGVRDHLSAAAR